MSKEITLEDPVLAEKHARLRALLEELGSVLVAFSAGVDSTLLLKVARDVLGDRAVALLAVSASLPARERDEARALAEALGARLVETRTGELQLEEYVRNDTDRCYHCKAVLLDDAVATARELGLAHVVLGTNADDLGDHRPGHRAARERGARNPLLEAGLTKDEVRALSKALGLPTWNKAEMACLASRIAYGQRVTAERLGQVEALEALLHDLGFDQVRARHHGEIVRLEVEPSDIPRLLDPALRERLLREGRALGFQYVALDLEGYRRGAMNEIMADASNAEDPSPDDV